MWVYAYKLNFDELKTAAFKTLDENWKMHQNSSEFLEMMKSAPNAVSLFHFFFEKPYSILTFDRNCDDFCQRGSSRDLKITLLGSSLIWTYQI